MFYGKVNKYNELREIGINKKDINIFWVSNEDSLGEINIQNLKGILIGNINDINKA